jgi:hypothetical protein
LAAKLQIAFLLHQCNKKFITIFAAKSILGVTTLPQQRYTITLLYPAVPCRELWGK